MTLVHHQFSVYWQRDLLLVNVSNIKKGNIGRRVLKSTRLGSLEENSGEKQSDPEQRVHKYRLHFVMINSCAELHQICSHARGNHHFCSICNTMGTTFLTKNSHLGLQFCRKFGVCMPLVPRNTLNIDRHTQSTDKYPRISVVHLKLMIETLQAQPSWNDYDFFSMFCVKRYWNLFFTRDYNSVASDWHVSSSLQIASANVYVIFICAGTIFSTKSAKNPFAEASYRFVPLIHTLRWKWIA